MIRVYWFGTRIQVSIFYLAVITLLSFLDQTGIAIWGFFASLLHEFGHIIALYLVGGRARLLSFEVTGIRMVQKATLGNGREAIVLSAGCIVNFLCCALCMRFGFLNGATVHLCIGLFNLLPSRVLDGGRLFVLFLSAFLSLKSAERLCFILSIITSVFLILFGVRIFIISWNPTLLITGGFLLISCRQNME